jgi:flagellar protein FlaG
VSRRPQNAQSALAAHAAPEPGRAEAAPKANPYLRPREDRSAQTGQTGQASQTGQPRQTAQTIQAAQAVRQGRAEQTDQPDRTNWANRTNQAGRAERADQADQTGQDPQGASETEEIDRAAKTFQDYLDSVPSEMSFSFDKEAGRSVFRLVNPVTGEVLKQFPPDEFLNMVKRLRDVSDAFAQGGALMDVRL